MATALMASPVSSGGLNTRCSTLAAEGAILMGDAGHSMWPSLGQGANAALESAGVLATDCPGGLQSESYIANDEGVRKA